MSCDTCGHINTNVPLTEYQKTEKLAALQARQDKRIYVVVKHNGVYFSECLQCRVKSGINHGTIITYVR